MIMNELRIPLNLYKEIHSMIRARCTTRKSIFVTGCARSGAILMRELMAAGFQEIIQLPNDTCLTDLTYNIHPLRKHVVASRDYPSSYYLRLEDLRRKNVYILWMIRHPFDVLTSCDPHRIREHDDQGGPDHEYYVSADLLILIIDFYLYYKNHTRVLTVRYEDLVTKPSLVQNRIAEQWDIKMARSFEECYQDFCNNKQSLETRDSIHPLGSIGHWKRPEYLDYIQEVFREYPELIQRGEAMGYDCTLPEA